VIRDSKRGGIVPGVVTKAYLPDVSISTVLRLTVSGWTVPGFPAAPSTFEFNSIPATKWLNLISRTMLPNVQCMITGVLSLLTSAGSVSDTSQLQIQSRMAKWNPFVNINVCFLYAAVSYNYHGNQVLLHEVLAARGSPLPHWTPAMNIVNGSFKGDHWSLFQLQQTTEHFTSVSF